MSGHEPGGRRPAPGPLRQVQAFVNTFDREGRRDALHSAAELHGWLAGEQLIKPGAEVGLAALRQAAAIREGLRLLAGVNNGVPLDASTMAQMDATVRELGITLSVAGGGELRLTAPSSFGQAMAALVDIVRTAMDDGRWARMKACRRDICQWVFYDSSRNHSSHWCTMDICGNRVKTTNFYHRAKQRLPDEPAAPSITR